MLLCHAAEPHKKHGASNDDAPLLDGVSEDVGGHRRENVLGDEPRSTRQKHRGAKQNPRGPVALRRFRIHREGCRCHEISLRWGGSKDSVSDQQNSGF